jgi:hypothetical protein
MQFHEKRRQQFLGEQSYADNLKGLDDGIADLEANLLENHEYPESLARISRSIAFDRLSRLLLQYTAGENITALRVAVEDVVAAFERNGAYLWQSTGDRNEMVFQLTSIDDYSSLLQTISLCFLLHRRDLLPRIALLQDGERGENGGADNLYEELMAHGLGAAARFESDWISAAKPYQALSDALFTESNDEALKHLNRFLKTWYKDLAGCAWHDAHKPDQANHQWGYHGYWSFEAGAAVLLLGIDDDSSLHQYLYYPKDLVAWARANKHLSEPDTTTQQVRLRCEANQPCPREGFWFTPAQAGSRRFFKAGEVMPEISGDFGTTIWQWDQNQDASKP